MALPLAPAIRARLPKSFDVDIYLQPSQKAVGKIIYALFRPYLPSPFTSPLSSVEAHLLVQENYAEAMSQVRSRSQEGKIDFWVERDGATIHFDPSAIEELRSMPSRIVAYHFWTLWALETFSSKAARSTFIDFSPDEEHQRLKKKATNRQSILNRIVYDVYLPFIESTPGGIQSKDDIINLGRQNFSSALESIHVLITTLTAEKKRYARQLTSWEEKLIVNKLKCLWEDGVFSSKKSRSRYLAPPFTSTRTSPCAASLQGDQCGQESLDNTAEDDSFQKPPSKSQNPLPKASASVLNPSKIKKGVTRANRTAKRRNVYLAIKPFIEPYIGDIFLEQKLETLVHQCLKTPTYLNTIPVKHAVDAVMKLWRGRAFHDSEVRRQILGINQNHPNHQDVLINRDPALPSRGPVVITPNGDQPSLVTSTPYPRPKETVEDTVSSTFHQRRKWITRLDQREKAYREVYFATLPIIRCHLHRKLTHKKIAAIVREHQKLQGIFTRFGERRLINHVWVLWTKGVFHDRQRLHKVLGADIDNACPTRYEDIENHHEIHNSDLLPAIALNNRGSAIGAKYTAQHVGKKGRQTHPLSPITNKGRRSTSQPSAPNPSTISTSGEDFSQTEPVADVFDTGALKFQGCSTGSSSSLPAMKVHLAKTGPDPKGSANSVCIRSIHDRTMLKSSNTQPVATRDAERSLDDLYRDYPEKMLGHVDQTTPGIIAMAIKQIAEEAVFEWLNNWHPTVDWIDVIHSHEQGNKARGSILVPKEAITTEDGVLSVSELLQNCQKVYEKSESSMELDMMDTVNNAMELCRILKDDKRRISLEKTGDKIRASRSTLYLRTMGIKRQASNRLNSFNKSVLEGFPTYFQSQDFRHMKETLILDEALSEFKRFCDTASMELLGVLKMLLDSS